ncbi:MAG: hypothetical protein J7513_09060 [Solirubrobacteraceae bacterium]|nr:hypothetical protein [Solirubrobacteraceae bacterium]
MTPFLERRSLPPGHRRWLVVLSGALLVAPVGALFPGNDSSTAEIALAVLMILLVAPILGVGLARPRRTITVDGERGTITVRTSGELPDPRAREREWPISAARAVELEDLGNPAHPSWGVRIELANDEPIHLNAFSERELAQDTVDHLVLLGLPGHSRAAEREAALSAGPPETWL